MSYDLAVFKPSVAPIEREQFLAWVDRITQWQEPHTYNDPEVSSPALRSWFFEMIEQFPPMNGAYAKEDVDDPCVTDYSLGETLIYSAFAWSKAEEAFKTTIRLAEKHQVGFYHVSSAKGEVYFPDLGGRLVLAFECFGR